MEKITATVLEMIILQGILLLLGIACLTVGIVTIVGINVKYYYAFYAAIVGILMFFVGVYIVFHSFSELQQSLHLRKLQDATWVAQEKERLKEKFRNKTEEELMRELGKIYREKYKSSRIYWRVREKFGISPDMVVNSKNEAKRQAIMEILREAYGWR